MTYINTVERVQLRQATAEGIQIGRQEGRQEGVVKTLSNLFGNVPEWAQQRLDEATQEQLDQWTAAIY